MGGSGLHGWYVAWTCSHSKVGQKVKEDLAYWAETQRLAMNVLSKKTCEPSVERSGATSAAWRGSVCLSLAFMILNLADCALTQVALDTGMRELNMLWAGCPWLKMIPVTFIAWFLRREKRVMAALAAGMSLIVAWNSVMLWLYG